MMRISIRSTSRRHVIVLLLSCVFFPGVSSPVWANEASVLTSPTQVQLAASSSDGNASSEDTTPSGAGQIQPPAGAPDKSGNADPARPNVDPNAPLPEIMYDLGKLPEPVRKMHDALVAACKSGDIEKLRPLLSNGNEATQLTLGEMDEDPIKFLHDQAGDEGGQEILAIMEEILDAGYVHLDAGKPQELYVWPYFFALPLDKLTAPQRVELFRIITAGDYEDMKSVGAYVFYRLGITPQGKWAFFVAGD